MCLAEENRVIACGESGMYVREERRRERACQSRVTEKVMTEVWDDVMMMIGWEITAESKDGGQDAAGRRKEE